ncbi:MAG: response regulator transcription factor [Actinomycetota bacterium]
MSETITILVVDDHDLLRSGVKTSLARFDDLEVIGEARTGEEAIALNVELQPSVVVMDLLMPGMGGVAATRELRRTSRAQVLALTSFVDNELVQQALDAGAASYLLKNVDADELAEAIRMTARGGSAFAREATRVLSARREIRPLDDLTEREREVASLLADGRSNADIARELSLSIFTVKNHVSQILTKLQVKSRTQAAAVILRTIDPSA